MAGQALSSALDGSGRSRPPCLRLLAAASSTVSRPHSLRSVKLPKSGDSSRPSPLLFRRPTRLPGSGSRTAHRLRCDADRWTCRTGGSKISSIRFDRAIERPQSMLSCLVTASVCKELAAPDRGVFQAGSYEAFRKRELLPDHENGRVPSACMYPGPVEALSRGIGSDFRIFVRISARLSSDAILVTAARSTCGGGTRKKPGRR